MKKLIFNVVTSDNSFFIQLGSGFQIAMYFFTKLVPYLTL